MPIDFSFIQGAMPQVPENKPVQTNDDVNKANVTLRVDADCFLLCDGEFTEIELTAGKLTKVKLPIGQHLLEFVDVSNPKLKIEQAVDWPEEGKSYLVLVDGLEVKISQAHQIEAEKRKEEAERKAKAEAEKKAKEEAERKAIAETERKRKEAEIAAARKKVTYFVKITSITNSTLAMMTTRTIFGWSLAEFSEQTAKLPILIKTSNSKSEIAELSTKLSEGGFGVNISAKNGLGESVEIPKQEKPVKNIHLEQKNDTPLKITNLKKTISVHGVSFNMIGVKAGTFLMGSTQNQVSKFPALRDSIPQHEVTITKDYYLGETLVTQALWKCVMGNNPSKYKGDNRPVDSVSWADAQEFIKKLSALTHEIFRLPTEAEWEFAARGGIKCKNFVYAGSNDVDDVAWCYQHNETKETHPVAQKSPNELGLYDMSGNVFEWCQDHFEKYSDAPSVDPQDPNPKSKNGHVYRGGAFSSSNSLCVVSARCYTICDPSGEYYGLRLAI